VRLGFQKKAISYLEAQSFLKVPGAYRNSIARRVQTMSVLDELLRPAELAAELEVCEMTLKRWRRIGSGPPVTKIGRRIFYARPSVVAWLASSEVNSRKRATA
jgi:Helix-turn-helix domain